MTSLPPRYLALDVLRGLTLAFMIIVNTPGSEATTYAPLLHANWHGFTPTDLVFATFLFVVGNALSFTEGRYAALGDATALRKIGKRTATIFLLGYLLYWFPFAYLDADGWLMLKPIGATRIPGVLQRIALGYGCTALIVHFWKARGALIVGVAALLAYWAILYAGGDYTLAGNAVLKLDRLLLGEPHLYHGEGIAFDPEGLLSTLPAIANVVAGYLAGRWLQQRGQGVDSIERLMLAGLACIAIALCWNTVFPINKKLWTSSYALLTIGLDLLLLPLLVYVIEVRAQRRWTYFFEVFGRNTLFIYLLSEVGVVLLMLTHVGTQTVYEWLYATLFAPLASGYNASLLFAVATMLSCWGVAYLLDRKRIYIKV